MQKVLVAATRKTKALKASAADLCKILSQA